jgi:hypothetical protein
MAYTTATAVATLLGTSFSASTDPTATEVNDIIARIEDYVEAYTGRIWSSSTTTEYFDTVDEMRLAYGQPAYFPQDVQRTFFLTNRPVISIDSLQQNFQTSTDWESLATGYAEDALFYGGPGYVEFHNSPPPAGWKNVKITYTYGISTTPNDIKYATELLAAVDAITALRRSSSQLGQIDFSTIQVGNVSYTLSDIAVDRLITRWQEMADRVLKARGRTVNVGML